MSRLESASERDRIHILQSQRPQRSSHVLARFSCMLLKQVWGWMKARITVMRQLWFSLIGRYEVNLDDPTLFWIWSALCRVRSKLRGFNGNGIYYYGWCNSGHHMHCFISYTMTVFFSTVSFTRYKTSTSTVVVAVSDMFKSKAICFNTELIDEALFHFRLHLHDHDSCRCSLPFLLLSLPPSPRH